MTSLRFRLALLFLFLFIGANLPAQKLPRSIPEAEGVSSNSILQFVNATAKSKTEFHSFMLLRHGKVIAEGWWNPYRSDLRHSLYSCSKSFTATAIGFAVQEHKLSVDDKVISFFPNELPDTVSSWLKELSVKDVLMMSDGQEPDPSFVVAGRDTNWVKGFLATPILHEPGSVFLYNSLGTYMLSAIITKVTEEKLIDYLKPRLFDPLGIMGEDWEQDLLGRNTGGWGLRLKTEDMAKFAQLFLQKGKWNGKQVLSASWVEEASTMKIMQNPNASQSAKDSSDWLQGYCYQMWRCRHNAFRGDGAYGQFMIVMPEQDAVLVITAETPDMQEEINLVWQYLLPSFNKQKLPANANDYTKLQQKIKSLALPLAQKKISSMAAAMNGKRFTVSSNNTSIQTISFRFANEVCNVSVEVGGKPYSFPFGGGKWAAGTSNLPGPSLTAAAIENTSMLYPAKTEGSYTWKDDHTLELVLRYIESPHSEVYTCHFDGNKLTIETSTSISFGKNKILVEASAK